MKRISLFSALLVSLVSACEPQQPATAPVVGNSSPPTPAPVAAPAATQGTVSPMAPVAAGPIVATIDSKSGSRATGQVVLTEAGAGVHVVVTVEGAAPGTHGLHFHENGDCSAMDGTSAKGHYNPENHAHGLPTAGVRHLGDLGNIEVKADGKGRLEMDLPNASLVPGAPNTLRGKAVVLHEKTDDGSQPAGNSGARIGCAVVP